MEWILDHLQLVIAVVIIVGYVLRGMRRSTQEDAPGQDVAPQTEEDTDEAERTRRIQEEIRRRILERQRGQSPPPPRPVIVIEDRQSEASVLRPRPQEWRQVQTPPPIPRTEEPESGMAAVLERQRTLDEQLRAIRAARAAAAAEVGRSPMAMPSIPTGGDSMSGAVRELRRDLSGVHSLRKAVLLREILGEPVGMRRGHPELSRR